MPRWPLALLAAFVAPLGGCPVPAPFHAVVIADRSDSMEDGSGRTCPALAGLVTRALGDGAVDVRSSVTVYASPDRDGAAPAVLLDAPIPVSGGIEGQAKGRAARDDLLARFRASCDGALGGTTASPLFATLADGVAHLRAKGCAADGRCVLLVVSDLQETANRPVKDATAALARWLTKHPGEAPEPALAARLAALPTLDTRGVDVFVCGRGHGALSGADGEALARATETVWRGVLVGGAVTFDPTCPAG